MVAVVVEKSNLRKDTTQYHIKKLLKNFINNIPFQFLEEITGPSDS